MMRLVSAARNSWRALSFLLANEPAVRLEAILLVLSVPVAYLLTGSWEGFALLVASILILIVVEVLNTAVEAACNAITRETNRDIGLAKDCGSLAVAIAGLLVFVVWCFALAAWLAGAPY
jgi:diacylglycerol kinase (ATP)